jgi:hypothetical protein
MPPFYIGCTTEGMVLNGYNGSVKSKKYKGIWQKERKENRYLFKTVIISRHNTNESARKHEEYLHRFFDVVKNCMFINMAIGSNFGGFESISPRFRGRHHSEESRQRIRESSKGKKRGKYKKEIKPRKSRAKEIKPRPPRTKEHLLAQSLSHLGKKKCIICKKVICPHCGLLGAGANMTRYHFDKCKFRAD